MLRRLPTLALPLGLLGLATCGAEGMAPPPDPPLGESCGSVHDLAPTIMDIATGTDASAVSSLIAQLQEPVGEGPTARDPFNELLQTLVAILTDYARDPAEAGGAPCGLDAPPRGQYHNRACMIRRLLDPERGGEDFQAESISALKGLLPLVGDLLAYMTGEEPVQYDEDGDGDFSHYVLVDLVRNTCQQDAVCGAEKTIGLLVALVDYMATPAGAGAGALGGCGDPATLGERLFCGAEAFVLDPDFGGPDGFWESLSYGDPDNPDDGLAMNRPGFLALFGLVLDSMLAAPNDPDTYFDGIEAQLAFVRQPMVTSWPDGTLVPSFDALTAELKLMLHPDRGVLLPLQAGLACMTSADERAREAEEERTGRTLEGPLLLVTVHTLLYGSREDPILDLPSVIEDVKAVMALDPDGVMLAVVQDLLHAIQAHRELYEDPGAALPVTCKLLFDREAAQRLLPSVADLLDSRLLEELVCVGDVLVYGCAGGERPSICEPPASVP